MKNDAIIVIPARYSSKRLLGKVLLNKTGKYLIQHVWESAMKVKNKDRVVIATDDVRVLEACKKFGAECVITSPKHKNGTERASEICEKLKYKKVVNMQGDEPELPPNVVERVIAALDKDYMVTVSVPFETILDRKIFDRVKVVYNKKGYALYFSRHQMLCADLHVGIYGYHRDFLLQVVKLAPTQLEIAEKLEQMRALEHGFKIKVIRMNFKSYGGIDTLRDYNNFLKRSKSETSKKQNV